MKKENLPHSYKRQRLLHDPGASPESLVSLGERYLEAERVVEAAEFFLKAGHQEGVDRLKKIAIAVEQGDSFLFKMLAGGVPGKGTRKEWETLGNRAEALEKYSHAVRAFTAAENEEGRKRAEESLDRIRTELKPWPENLRPEDLRTEEVGPEEPDEEE